MIDEKQVEDNVVMIREKKEEVIEVFVSKDCLADLKKDEHEMIVTKKKLEDGLVQEEEVIQEVDETEILTAGVFETELVDEKPVEETIIIEAAVSEAEPVDEKVEEPVEETVIIEPVVSTTAIIADEVSVSETELVNDKLKV